jgi:undecaprenyl-diphosphatase
MFVLSVCFGAATAAGIISWLAIRNYWDTDAGAPRVDPSTLDTEVRRHRGAVLWLRSHLDPTAATGSILGVIGVVAVVGGGAFGLLLTMVRTHQGFARFDGSAARFGASHATGTSTQVLRILTQAGGAYVIIPLAIVVGAAEMRRNRSWLPAAFLTVVVGGQYLLADLIKLLVDRTRPDLLRLTGFSGPSFPSGHATASAAVFAAMALLAGRGRSRSVKAALSAVSVGAAVLVAATRVLLGVHWLTDVMAGLILGWTWFAVTSIAFGGRLLRFGAPLQIAEHLATEDDQAATAGA